MEEVAVNASLMNQTVPTAAHLRPSPPLPPGRVGGLCVRQSRQNLLSAGTMALREKVAELSTLSVFSQTHPSDTQSSHRKEGVTGRETAETWPGWSPSTWECGKQSVCSTSDRDSETGVFVPLWTGWTKSSLERGSPWTGSPGGAWRRAASGARRCVFRQPRFPRQSRWAGREVGPRGAQRPGPGASWAWEGLGTLSYTRWEVTRRLSMSLGK